ncbi:hypothetical protein [Sporosarcina sp. P35]|nr:hypothetical protein [Sporosarcina sp. P35]
MDGMGDLFGSEAASGERNFPKDVFGPLRSMAVRRKPFKPFREDLHGTFRIYAEPFSGEN